MRPPRRAVAPALILAGLILARPALSEEVGPAPAEAEVPEGGAVKMKQPETLLELTVAGGWLMIPIALSSVLGLAFLVERLIRLQRRRVLPPALASGMRSLMRERTLDRERADSLIASHPSPAASVLRAAAIRLDQERDEIVAAVNEAAAREVYDLRRNVRAFAVIASVAPLLGLLGTVIGLIECFREVAMSGLGSGASLAPGMYVALITTAAGLFVAIPSLLVYYWLGGRIDRFVHEIDLLVGDYVEAHRLSTYAGSPA